MKPDNDIENEWPPVVIDESDLMAQDDLLKTIVSDLYSKKEPSDDLSLLGLDGISRPTVEGIRLAERIMHKLQPGQEVGVAAILLNQASLDHVLSGKIGSGYEYGYIFPGDRPENWKNWTIFRLKDSLENDQLDRRAYVDPDRRHLFNRDKQTGIYTRK